MLSRLFAGMSPRPSASKMALNKSSSIGGNGAGAESSAPHKQDASNGIPSNWTDASSRLSSPLSVLDSPLLDGSRPASPDLSANPLESLEADDDATGPEPTDLPTPEEPAPAEQPPIDIHPSTEQHGVHEDPAPEATDDGNRRGGRGKRKRVTTQSGPKASTPRRKKAVRSNDVPEPAVNDTEAPSTSGQNSDNKQYPVHKILDFRREGDDVELLVQWGGKWLHDEPTWEPEEELWHSCRKVVSKFWSPSGWNRRNRVLGLDPITGPFIVSRILGERKMNKVRSREQGGVAYLVEFVGYDKAEWTPENCLPSDAIKEWKTEGKKGKRQYLDLVLVLYGIEGAKRPSSPFQFMLGSRLSSTYFEGCLHSASRDPLDEHSQLPVHQRRRAVHCTVDDRGMAKQKTKKAARSSKLGVILSHKSTTSPSSYVDTFDFRVLTANPPYPAFWISESKAQLIDPDVYETRFVGRTETAWVAATKVRRVLIAEFWESYKAHSGRSQEDWLEGRKSSRSTSGSLGLEKDCKSLEDKGSARPDRKKRAGRKHEEDEDDLPSWFPALKQD
ncbi:chromodomain protein [Colletotrichum camelliae]|nr:chromodomain protein [Colletotrichum camelliae]